MRCNAPHQLDPVWTKRATGYWRPLSNNQGCIMAYELYSFLIFLADSPRFSRSTLCSRSTVLSLRSGGCRDDGSCICHQSHGLLQQHPVWRQPCSHTASSECIQPYAAARLILHKGKYDRITAAIRDSLHWLVATGSAENRVQELIRRWDSERQLFNDDIAHT